MSRERLGAEGKSEPKTEEKIETREHLNVNKFQLIAAVSHSVSHFLLLQCATIAYDVRQIQK